MKNEVIAEHYSRMKSKRGNDTLILFHVGNYFEAYFDDAATIAPYLGVKPVTNRRGTVPAVFFPEDKIEEVNNKLLDDGFGTCISEVRGKGGKYVLDTLE